MKPKKPTKLKKRRLKDHEIDLLEASNLTANYRDAQTETVYVKAQFFGTEGIQAILNQTDCIGIRIYYGLSNQGVPKLVLVGVNEAGNDQCEDIVLDKGIACPPDCSEDNSLNC
ncbi:MAG: hypothetical protein V4590_08870 [Bacteroidota bacterium]